MRAPDDGSQVFERRGATTASVVTWRGAGCGAIMANDGHGRRLHRYVLPRIGASALAPNDGACSGGSYAFRDALRAAGGGRIARLILYGSRARGDFRPDSDFDFLVLAKPGEDRTTLRNDLWNAIFTADAPFDTEVNLFVEDHDFLGRPTILTHNVRTDGVEL